MFLEPQIQKNTSNLNTGWIEVVCGSMFSGKTEELIRRVKRAIIAQQRVMIFKPAVDKRYDDEKVVSHNQSSVNSMPIQHSSEILQYKNDFDVIGIDEAQFFDMELVDVCNELANSGVRVIISGLDMDFQGKPFGVMPYLLCIAEFVTKLHAICTESGTIANYSFRTSEEEGQLLLGEKDKYLPLSRKEFIKNTSKEYRYSIKKEVKIS